MAATSEERREVAARLRGLDSAITSRDTLEQAVDKLLKATYGERPFSPMRYSVRNLCGLGYVLADLIDPTCYIESVDSTGRLLAYRLSCWDTAYVAHPALRPSYCPICGARVVDA